ncbi:MAG TPA: hypothetical protein VJ987_00720 [Anaerolineales bacterium]|nr:hypothetical protein [Anaerolineales bacterium]
MKEKKAPHTQRLVPIDLIFEITLRAVHLKCDTVMLQDLPPFVDVEYIQSVIPYYGAVYGTYYMQPLVSQERKIIPVEHHHIPLHELPITRGAMVKSSDSHHIGNVDEFLANETNGHITHLIMREGHLWGQKDVSIPVSEIDHMDEHNVYLKIDKKKVSELPIIPIERKWA